jgi:phosphatidylserine/phosphatidylglycerophosphate/cardiolipin synthase-like enzyme
MRIKIKLKLLFTLFLLSVTLQASDIVYLLPKESKEAYGHIEKLIKEAKSNIDITMYNFSLKSLAKALIQAKKRGVDVKVFLDEKKSKEKSSEYELLKKGGVDVALINKVKLHTKLAIFDKKIAVFGSSNWTKASFDENYEIIYVSKQENMVEKLNGFINQLKER